MAPKTNSSNMQCVALKYIKCSTGTIMMGRLQGKKPQNIVLGKQCAWSSKQRAPVLTHTELSPLRALTAYDPLIPFVHI